MSALKLITDRTLEDKNYLDALNKKGLHGMTPEERAYWRCGIAEVLEFLDGTIETSDGLILGAGSGVTKGSYNRFDLHRVDSAVQAVAQQALSVIPSVSAYLALRKVAPDKAFELPYLAEDVNVKSPQQWLDGNVPTHTELSEFLDNVRNLRALLPSDAPELPSSMARLSVDGANNIEKTLLAVEAALTALEENLKDKINRTASSYLYSCEVYSGEV